MSTEDAAVAAGVEREKQITEMKLARLREKVAAFEEEHGMDSETFRERFEAGDIGDEEEFMEWDMMLDAIAELERKLEELSRFPE